MSFWEKFDKIVEKFITFFSIFFTGVLIVFTLVLVVSRYFLHLSLHGWEETPIMIMTIIVWVAAVLVARKDNMISIDLIYIIVKNEKAQLAIRAFGHLVSILAMGYFSYLAYEFVADSIAKNIRSAAVGFPMWPVHSVVLIGAVGMTLAYLANFISTVRRLISK